MGATSEPEVAAPDPRPLTIAQIAARTGVSVATVSKVVNGRSAVSADTRRMVENVIREHGYRRQRRQPQHAPILEVMLNFLGGDYAMQIITGVEKVAHEHDMAVAVSGLHGQHTPGRSWIEGVLARRPAGVIAVLCSPTPAQHERLRLEGIPLVLVDPFGEPDGQYPSVSCDNWSGGLAAARHLLEMGHRRIGVISGPADTLCSRARVDGYRAALDAAAVPVDPTLIVEGDFGILAGRALTHELIKMPEPPTAIFACGDRSAVGVYRAAHEARLRIPEDLSVIGFDDIPQSEWTNPPLTTVRQPMVEMAQEAAAMVMTLARAESLRYNQIVLATGLVVRGSTASPAV